ncbi:MAG: TonB C-terminal domain-containing protein, partial [Deltaproteobacteria bacterium]|nr:TonB C-terminal domain-containing protein [Deltaproteobacteria bacterium]
LVKKNALKRVKKKVEESRPTPIQEALDRIKNRVSADEKSGRDLTKPESANAADNTGGRIGRKRTLDLLDIYQAEIPFYIQKNWAFSEQLAGGRTDLLAVLVIKIMHDGQIQDIWYERRSGNRYLDESAYKAIQKSNPLPSLPKGIRRAFIQVGLRFTPSGLD